MDPRRLRNLNFQHLLYFFVTVREGGVGRAAEVLNVSQPTMSAQIKKLERTLGHPLFQRQGRGLAVTEFGRGIHEYATRIFREGERMLDGVDGDSMGGRETLVVGIVDAVPKLLSRHLLDAVFELEPQPVLVCIENKIGELIASLATHRCDVVLSDAPLDANSSVRAFNHELGASFISLFGTAVLVEQYGKDLPTSLEGAPVLMPGEGASLRRSLEQWLDSHAIRPLVVAECDDQALNKSFGAAGRGFFVAPSLVAEEVCAAHGVLELLRLEGVVERFYAITTERRLRHPLVTRVSERAKRLLSEA